eukprot:Em0003g1583a
MPRCTFAVVLHNMALECADTFLFTSESVGEGHPDKMCDQISDAILDECLRSDPESKVACECAAKDNVVILVGEVTTKAQVNFKKVVCDTAQRIGYDDISKGFDYRSCTVINLLSKQSPDIAQAVYENKAAEQLGAGDQVGVVNGRYGYFPEPHKMVIVVYVKCEAKTHDSLRIKVARGYLCVGGLIGDECLYSEDCYLTVALLLPGPRYGYFPEPHKMVIVVYVKCEAKTHACTQYSWPVIIEGLTISVQELQLFMMGGWQSSEGTGPSHGRGQILNPRYAQCMLVITKTVVTLSLTLIVVTLSLTLIVVTLSLTLIVVTLSLTLIVVTLSLTLIVVTLSLTLIVVTLSLTLIVVTLSLTLIVVTLSLTLIVVTLSLTLIVVTLSLTLIVVTLSLTLIVVTLSLTLIVVTLSLTLIVVTLSLTLIVVTLSLTLIVVTLSLTLILGSLVV